MVTNLPRKKIGLGLEASQSEPRKLRIVDETILSRDSGNDVTVSVKVKPVIETPTGTITLTAAGTEAALITKHYLLAIKLLIYWFSPQSMGRYCYSKWIVNNRNC